MSGKQEVISGVLSGRAKDCFDCERALNGGDDERLHAFRLACKRLRFSIELFERADLKAVAEQLSRITDELGAAHDCAVLAKRARRCEAGRVAVRAASERAPAVVRAAAIWNNIRPVIEERIK